MTEGCEFRDLQSEFDALGVTIYGCSFDQVAVNAQFAAVNNFKYRLFSDPNRDLALQYGAASSTSQPWANRVTVVLDPGGNWVLSYNASNTKQHPHDVLADMELLLGL